MLASLCANFLGFHTILQNACLHVIVECPGALQLLVQINPVTAYGFLEVIQVPKEEYLLQQAANSVLGKELISMAQKRGTKTINLVRRHEVVDELKQLGCVLQPCSHAWSRFAIVIIRIATFLVTGPFVFRIFVCFVLVWCAKSHVWCSSHTTDA